MRLNNYEKASRSYLINQPLGGGTCMHAPYPKEFSTKGLRAYPFMWQEFMYFSYMYASQANLLWYQAYILWVGRKQQGPCECTHNSILQLYTLFIRIEKLILCWPKGGLQSSEIKYKPLPPLQTFGAPAPPTKYRPDTISRGSIPYMTWC